MTNNNNNRQKWIHVRLTTEEHLSITKTFRQTTCQTLSEFARKLILGKPVTVNFRNSSMDDCVAEIIMIRNELSAIGNNYNQVVRKLHTLKSLNEVQGWLLLHEKIYNDAIRKIEWTRRKLTELGEQWSRS